MNQGELKKKNFIYACVFFQLLLLMTTTSFAVAKKRKLSRQKTLRALSVSANKWDGTVDNWVLQPDGYLKTLGQAPREHFFLTADGHRHPPFTWVNADIQNHFIGLMNDRKLCLYVEKFQSDVNAASIPQIFNNVFQQGKVFGWEPPLFHGRIVQIHTGSLHLMENLAYSESDWRRGNRLRENYAGVARMSNNLRRFKQQIEDAFEENRPNFWINAQSNFNPFVTYWKGRAGIGTGSFGWFNGEKTPKNVGTEQAYKDFLIRITRQIGILRDRNEFIAEHIMSKMDECGAADTTHLIAMGGRHLNCGENDENECVTKFLKIPSRGYVDKDPSGLLPRRDVS